MNTIRLKRPATASPVEGPAPLLIDSAAAARLLGIKERRLDRLVSQQAIPVVRLGPRCLRFDPLDLQAWLERGRQQRLDATITAPEDDDSDQENENGQQ